MTRKKSASGATFAVPARAFGGLDETTGLLLNERAIVERVGWLSSITTGVAQRIVNARWDADELTTLSVGVGLDGKPLPSQGYVAMRRLGWEGAFPDGVTAPERARRIGEEAAARLLRGAVWREQVLSAIVQTWPAGSARTSAEWDALWAGMPDGAAKATVRNWTRRVAAFVKKNDRLPKSVTELEGAPRVHGQVLFAAADKQLVQLLTPDTDDADQRLVLRVQLPTVATPTSYKQWTWHQIRISVPSNVPPAAVFSTPTLRIKDGALRVDLPWTIPVPPARHTGHEVGIGFDWGYNTFLTGTVGRLVCNDGAARVVASGRPLMFDASGVSAKVQAIRKHRERAWKKLDHYDRLLERVADPDLMAKALVLVAELERINARQRNLNRALARNAARWAVNQALAAGAGVIYVEDLNLMETRKLGKTWNGRLGGHVRGQVLAALKDAATKVGIAVATVPPRGTSSGCPRCNGTVKHVKAPDRPTKPGHKWSVCKCGMSQDRDHAAAERILARGLLGQDHTKRTRAGDLHIRATVDGPVTHPVRDKRT